MHTSTSAPRSNCLITSEQPTLLYPPRTSFTPKSALLFNQLRRYISSHSTSEYVVAAGKPPLDYYLKSHLPVVRSATVDEDPYRLHNSTHPAWRADIALIAHSGVHLPIILIDHASRSVDHASLPGSVAEAYASYYHLPPNDVQLLFFSIKTSSFIHCVAHDFLECLFASFNAAYIQALQCFLVDLQSVRAHSISVVREFITHDILFHTC